jgi:GH35 family endo-1,4-beta-xylanase
MKKKYLIGAAAGIMVALVLFGVGVSSCSAKETPAAVFAFASDRAGAGDIFVLDQTGQVQNLTNNPSGDWDPVWSPDGQMLTFTSHRAGNSDIWLLTPGPGDGPSDVRALTTDPAWDYSPTWSPSGQSVAFVSERDGDPEIFVQHLEEDTALQLTFNSEMDRLPAWSPDGKYIAFAAVRNGVEEIHRIWSDGTGEQIITPPALNGTYPAWSPDSQRLAFIGWDEQDRSGIYIIGPQADDLELLYQANSWLGNLNWSADGQWLTFTAWTAGNHDLYALPVTGGVPTRLVIDQAWDDFLAIHPAAEIRPGETERVAQAAAASEPADRKFAYGVNLADLSLAYLVNDMGFGWAKSYVNWETVEPEPGNFRWVDPDNIVNALGEQQVQILMRVHGTPSWARPRDSSLSHPPQKPEDFGRFMTALATRYKGQVAAYEIWNEPNLYYEWGNLPPDPAAYTELLQVAYTAIKEVDPAAIVISGGLSTTGQGSDTAYGDLAFLEGMYEAGAKDYFDALGSHPYAYGRGPDEIDPDGLSLTRVQEQRRVMLAHDDGDTPIWITEVGWVLQTSWELGEHEKIGVTEWEQGEYLSQAYTKVRQEWPYVEGMFLFNLDFSTVSWYPAAETMRWYAILNPDRTPRPAYTMLRQLMHP